MGEKRMRGGRTDAPVEFSGWRGRRRPQTPPIQFILPSCPKPTPRCIHSRLISQGKTGSTGRTGWKSGSSSVALADQAATPTDSRFLPSNPSCSSCSSCPKPSALVAAGFDEILADRLLSRRTSFSTGSTGLAGCERRECAGGVATPWRDAGSSDVHCRITAPVSGSCPTL